MLEGERRTFKCVFNGSAIQFGCIIKYISEFNQWFAFVPELSHLSVPCGMKMCNRKWKQPLGSHWTSTTWTMRYRALLSVLGTCNALSGWHLLFYPRFCALTLNFQFFPLIRTVVESLCSRGKHDWYCQNITLMCVVRTSASCFLLLV